MPLTDKERAFCKHLNVPAIVLERAKTIIELVVSMSYFSIEERGTLLHEIVGLENIDYDSIIHQSGIDLSDAQTAWNLKTEQLFPLFSKLGAESISTHFPKALEKMTGNPPAKVKITNTVEVPEVQMADPKRQTERAFQRMDIVLCQHDPTSGTYQYTLLMAGHHHRRTLQIPATKTALGELIPIPIGWGSVDINATMCTATPYPPKHPEEDEIIQDMIRQHGPFDLLFKLDLECDVPVPCLRESEIELQDTDIRVMRHQSIQVRGLSIQHNSRVELDWPESTTLELPNGQDPRLMGASITKRKRQISDRHQSRGRTILRLRQIAGKVLDNAYVKCQGLRPTESRLQGVGGVGTIISAQVDQVFSGHTTDGDFYHTTPLPKDLSWSPFLGPTTGKMNIDERYKLNDHMVSTVCKHKPIQHKTAPMRIKKAHPLKQNIEKHGLPFTLCLNSAAELESRIEASDWAHANCAQQLAQAQHYGDLQIELHIADGYGLKIICQPTQVLEEVIDGEAKNIEHEHISMTYEHKSLKQPEYVKINIYSPDFKRTWQVENRCHRQIWTLTNSSPIRLHQPSWLDDSGEWKQDNMNHHIRAGWSYSGWWISSL